ncbi:MAG: tRNA threonylcarbamoyladenosine dehydratase [Muribaculaceae bacterium]|nr:tRNA threonylcarbamoyladenosine dehydratase [Muribaculaceae bacterium]
MNSIDTLSRARILLGTASMNKLREARVIVFGVGGVGSWCVESLVRSGLRHITIVDDDSVCPSNVNRQLMATTETIGRVKVDAMRDHLLTINPEVKVEARHDRFTSTTASAFDLDSYDYVVDAIDSVADKMLLIAMATRSRARLFSSMGAARKLDPSRVKVAEFYKVSGCPLARALRDRFKRSGTRPGRKFKCVYSDELVPNLGESDARERANGSLMHITAIFGLTLAGLIIEDLHKKD